ncbi:tripartite motif-containing protein 5-like [Penaeus japonicus]|uniref:tripartite motif-containing protein 5-like n=1 Tax=Penaeus japonicus TaxID=27405 RepID=UPI001C7124AB|nr:tripartite motif-containing protein 5-like [Penaeus japonicus]
MVRPCPVCRELYNESPVVPVSLSCGHSFCRRCLQTMLQLANVLKCPVCRILHSGAPLEQLPDNLDLLEAVVEEQPEEDTQQVEIKIIVKTLEDREFPIRIRPSEKLMELKERLCTQYGITPNLTRLIYKGRRLEDDKSPRDYGITDGTVIQMATCYISGEFRLFW